MKSRVLNVGLIGVGGYGQRHLEVVEMLAGEGLVRLAAVADPFLEQLPPETQARLQRLACPRHADYRIMLEKESALDLLVVTTPIPLHEQMAQDCLQYGCHTYLEKPPVPTVQQLEHLIRLDRQERMTIGFQMVTMPNVVQLQKWIRDGDLGDILHIGVGANWPRSTSYYERSEWAGKIGLNGSPVLDGPAGNGLSHIIQNIMFFAGRSGHEYPTPAWVEGGFYRARPIESYDLSSIKGAFANGTEFSSVLSHCSEELVPFSIRVRGSKGSAWIERDGKTLGSTLDPKDHPQAGAYPDALAKAGIGFYRETLAWVRGERPHPVVSLADCRGYQKTVCGGLASSQRIHTIDPGHWQIRGQGSASIYHVEGLAQAITLGLEKEQVLEELPLPWTKAGRRVALADADSFSWESLLDEESAPGPLVAA